MSKTVRIIRKFNLIVPLCDLVVGEDHRASTRMLMGAAVMTFGVGLVKVGVWVTHHYELTEHVTELVHFFSEEFGYMIHAIGATPYVELLASAVSSMRAKAALAAAAEVVAALPAPDLEEPKE